MTVLRQLLVYDKAINKKIGVTISEESPLFKHEGEKFDLAVIRSTNDVGQRLLDKKVPKKSFRLLWIDDEGNFSRAGTLIDTEYRTAFFVTEDLIVKKSEFERIQKAYELDRFISATQILFEGRQGRHTRQSIEASAKDYAGSFELFLSSEVERSADKGSIQITVRYPLQSSYQELSPKDWLALLDPSKKYLSSLGAHFAVDVNDWWSFNQRGIVDNEVDDSLCASLFAVFCVNDIRGRISDGDSIMDGRSLED